MLNSIRWVVALVALTAAVCHAGDYDCIVKVTSSDNAKAIGVGSGVVVRPDGWILTARHVIGSERASGIVVTLRDGRSLPADRVLCPSGAAEDVVAIKVAARVKSIRVASESPRVGDTVYSAGYPRGKFSSLRSTVTSVSIRDTHSGTTLVGIRSPIAPGHSGGPLWDTSGKLIGIASVSAGLSGADRRLSSPSAGQYSGSGIAGTGGMFLSLDRIRRVVAELPDLSPGRPVLTVVSLPGCVPCEQFRADWRDDTAWIQTALSKRYDVRFVDGQSAVARDLRVSRVPTFVSSDGRRIVGYNGAEWLLSRLGIDAAPDPPAEPPRVEESPVLGVPDAPTQEHGADSPPVGVEPNWAPDDPSTEHAATPQSERPRDSTSEAPVADAPVPTTGRPSAAETAVGLLPALAPLLPWTLGPAAGAGITVGGWLLRRYLQRRRLRKAGETDPVEIPRLSLPCRDHNETRQLLDLGRIEGRDSLSDSLRWMLAEDEAQGIGDDDERMTVANFLGRVDRRLEEIAPLSVRTMIKG